MTLRTAEAVNSAGAGTALTPYTPASSDTFSVNDLPAFLRVINGAGAPINVTFTDGGRTALGTAAAALSASAVTNGTSKMFKLTSTMADSTGLVTAAFSATTSITCEFFR